MITGSVVTIEWIGFFRGRCDAGEIDFGGTIEGRVLPGTVSWGSRFLAAARLASGLFNVLDLLTHLFN